MAKRKFYRAKRRFPRKRRRTFKKRRRQATKVSITRNIGAFGGVKQTIVKLRYADRTLLNPGAGTGAVALYTANSTYDPDTAVGGRKYFSHDSSTCNCCIVLV